MSNHFDICKNVSQLVADIDKAAPDSIQEADVHALIELSPGHFLDLAAEKNDRFKTIRSPFYILQALDRAKDMCHENSAASHHFFAGLTTRRYDTILKPFLSDSDARNLLSNLLITGLEKAPSAVQMEYCGDFLLDQSFNRPLLAPDNVLHFMHAQSHFQLSEHTPLEKRYTRFLHQARNCAEAAEILCDKKPESLRQVDEKALKMALSYMVITDYETILRGETVETPRAIFSHFAQDDKSRQLLNEAIDLGYSIFLTQANDTINQNPEHYNRERFHELTQQAYDELASIYRESYTASLKFYPEGTYDSKALAHITMPANKNVTVASGHSGPKTTATPSRHHKDHL